MLYRDSLNHVFSRLLEGVLGVKRCFIETVAKTGLFGATEYVLYRIPDNTDNRDPVSGDRGSKLFREFAESGEFHRFWKPDEKVVLE